MLDAQTAGITPREVKRNIFYVVAGRINYVYDDRYLATVNFRADGSLRFAKRNRWAISHQFH